MSNQWLLLVTILLLNACTFLPKAPLRIHINASHQLNLDAQHASLPMRLKIYQLSEPRLFQEAAFRQLWKSESRVLGKSLLDEKQLTINPGETRLLTLSRHPNARYLGVSGVFRIHHHDRWKAYKKLPGQLNLMLKPLVIRIKNDVVEIQ